MNTMPPKKVAAEAPKPAETKKAAEAAKKPAAAPSADPRGIPAPGADPRGIPAPSGSDTDSDTSATSSTARHGVPGVVLDTSQLGALVDVTRATLDRNTAAAREIAAAVGRLAAGRALPDDIARRAAAASNDYLAGMVRPHVGRAAADKKAAAPPAARMRDEVDETDANEEFSDANEAPVDETEEVDPVPPVDDLDAETEGEEDDEGDALAFPSLPDPKSKEFNALKRRLKVEADGSFFDPETKLYFIRSGTAYLVDGMQEDGARRALTKVERDQAKILGYAK